jgi:hypothetical protein
VDVSTGQAVDAVALAGDVHCGALVAKIIHARLVYAANCNASGHPSPCAEETSTERIAAAIDRIRGKGLSKSDGSDGSDDSESPQPDEPGDKLN